MAERIFLTGGSGFVGTAVLAQLLKYGHRVNALSRRGELGGDGRVTAIRGDLSDADALRQGMAGCAAVIHLVGIIAEDPGKGVTFQAVHVEGTRNVIEAAKGAGVGRLVHMSAMGTRSGARSQYHQSKWQAEELVRGSGLEWTILRPSLIHGPEGEFMQMEKRWATRAAAPWLFMPYFGGGLLGTAGAGKLQPVFVGDVARAFVEALERPRTIGKTYELGGPEVYTWAQLHHVASEIMVGKRRAALAVPSWWAMLLTRIVPRSLLPFSRDQVLMSQEDNVGDTREFVADFQWEPRGFAATLREYAGRM